MEGEGGGTSEPFMSEDMCDVADSGLTEFFPSPWLRCRLPLIHRGSIVLILPE